MQMKCKTLFKPRLNISYRCVLVPPLPPPPDIPSPVLLPFLLLLPRPPLLLIEDRRWNLCSFCWEFGRPICSGWWVVVGGGGGRDFNPGLPSIGHLQFICTYIFICVIELLMMVLIVIMFNSRSSYANEDKRCDSNWRWPHCASFNIAYANEVYA